MNLKKALCTGFAAMLAALTLSGCGGGGDVVVLIPPDEAVNMTIDDLKTRYNENNKLEISYWTGFGQTMTQAVDATLATFHEKYDFINVTHEPKGGYEGVYDAMIRGLNAKDLPNVAIGYPDHFAGYLASNVQYVLDPFFESDYGINLEDYYPQYLKENQSLQFKNPEEKTDPWTVGLPYNKSTESLVYNKSFFEAFGLEVPQTWDEVNETGKEIIATLKAGNYFGKVTPINYELDGVQKTWDLDLTAVEEADFYPISYDSQANFFITMVYQFGGEYTEMGKDLEEGFIKFNNPQALAALDYIKAMYNDHVIGIPSVWNEPAYCSVPFKAIKSIMTVSSTAGVANNIPAGNKFEIGIAPIPYKTADKKFVISQGANLGIFKNTDVDKIFASWLLVRYLTGGEYNHSGDENEFNANVDFAIASGYLPVTVSGEESAWYKQYLGSEELTPSQVDKAKIAVQRIANEFYIQENWNKFVDPAFVGSADIRVVVGNIVPFILTGAGGKIYGSQEAIDYAYTQLPGYQSE